MATSAISVRRSLRTFAYQTPTLCSTHYTKYKFPFRVTLTKLYIFLDFGKTGCFYNLLEVLQNESI